MAINQALQTGLQFEAQAQKALTCRWVMTRRYLGVAFGSGILLFSVSVLAQNDPGVRGGLQNTGGGLQQQGIPIPHPPLISRNPTTGAEASEIEQEVFAE